MKRFLKRPCAFSATAVLTLTAAAHLGAQSAPAGATADTPPSEEETIILSPFTVSAEDENSGYGVKDTLAGTRVRTELRDIGSAISVVNAQFLRDTGAKNVQDLLVYTTNTEVGGVGGNFGGLGNTNAIGERSSLLRPNGNTRVRGLDSADNTRDFFLSEVPWDGYNVGRVDIQRGPNSILFGVGSPAGIVNASINEAGFKNSGKFENRVGSYGTVRFSADANLVLLKNELAVRVSALNDETKYEQRPAFNQDRRIFGALRFDPRALRFEGASSSIRVNFEHGDVKANRPRSLPPLDGITPWFGSEVNKLTVEPIAAWQAGGVSSDTGGNANPWVKFGVLGRIYGPDVAFIYNQANATTASYVGQTGPSTKFGINSAGVVDASIGGWPFARPLGINNYNLYSTNKGLPGAAMNIYKDRTLNDPSIFDFFTKLIDGPNKKEWQNWDIATIKFDQTLFNNRLSFQLAYNHQDYEEGQQSFLDGTNYTLGIDINTRYHEGIPNPNVGRPYVANSGQGGNAANFIKRDSLRFSITGTLRAEDFLPKSRLTEALGRHVFTGVASQDRKETESRSWARWASSVDYATVTGQSKSISDGDRQVEWISYLGPDLRGSNYTSARGLNLNGITAYQTPPSVANVRYFDSHWARSTNPSDPNYVNPAAPYTSPYVTDPLTQADNPANYVGWVTQDFKILSADNGDIDQLYTDGNKSETIVGSEAAIWQGFFFNGNLVPTVGWRRDTIERRSTDALFDATTKVASMNYGLRGPRTKDSGESKSYSIVGHLPKFVSEKLPLGTTASVFYNYSDNFKDETRVDIQGRDVPNARGKTKDYGFTVTTFNDKLSLKVNWYETKVTNATLAGDPATAALGNNTYYHYLLEGWGAATAFAVREGLNGNLPGQEWFWDYALIDAGWNSAAKDPAVTARSQAAVNAWMATLPDQSFFDAYGMPVNVAKLKSSNPADWASGLPGWSFQNNGIGGLQAAGRGRIRGMYPIATSDNTSKGVEYELTAQPVKDWSISFNAAKTTATRYNLSESMASWIEATHTRMMGPAGDLRLWWAGGDTFRKMYNQNIWAAYLFQQQSAGTEVSELRPWRYNVVSNYGFSKGFLKGANVGAGYRWQKGQILGYGYNAVTDQLDVSKPYYGESEDAIDLWVGYQRKITRKIDWRIQLNLRNVGDDTRLVPISVQPDGSPAAARIQEGMTWQLTNTLSF
jgi:hypothetical protein